MRQLLLVRHAESASNAGLPTETPASIPLTDRGFDQAERFAKAWGEPPQLIVFSPYIRTVQTSRLLELRFPDVPTDEWAVQEWTYLCPERYKNTTHQQRQPDVEAFWDRNNPGYKDGRGAESFIGLFNRVGDMLSRASARKEDTIVMFTHGHFMRAVLWAVLFRGALGSMPETPDEMARFRQFCSAVEVPNVSMMTLLHNGDNEYGIGGRWTVGKFWNLLNPDASKSKSRP
jgi:broad specificity phosphatase PhoE